MSENKKKLALNTQLDVLNIVHSLKTWNFWKIILLMVVGSIIVAIAVNGLLIPNRFFDGGVNGISLMIFYTFGWPSIGIIYFVLNVPIFLICWREISLKFVFISLIGVFFLSAALHFIQDVTINVKDPIMVAVLAGVMVGFGTGIYLRIGGSTGGLDMVAIVLKKKFSIPMGNTFISINAIPLVGAVLLFDLNTALYTAIYMYVQSFVLNKVQTGFSQRKSVFIVSKKPDTIAELVIKNLDRGVTFFHSTGAYSHEEGRVIYTVINMRELGRLKELLFHIDPDAFIAISNTAEVIGSRFLTWEEEGFTPIRKQV